MEYPKSHLEQRLENLDRNIQEERNLKLNELISKFKDGEDRYRNNSMFHQVVDALMHGQDPIALLDIVLQSVDTQTKAMTRMMEAYGSKKIFVTEEDM